MTEERRAFGGPEESSVATVISVASMGFGGGVLDNSKSELGPLRAERLARRLHGCIQLSLCGRERNNLKGF